MFDNPKKELAWLEQQLLASEHHDEEDEFPDELEEDIYEDVSEDEPFDEELDILLNGGSGRRFDDRSRSVSGRAAGFDADDYEMDTDRYVPAPKRKSGCLTAFALIQALAIIGFVLWALWRML